MKIFALSDIHSFYNEMMEALNKQGFDINNQDHQIVVCGDLFDRGPDARKVLDFMKKMSSINRLTYISGNHETLLLQCLLEIARGQGISYIHDNNCTTDTITQITGINRYDLSFKTFDLQKFSDSITKLTDFIFDCAVDYAEFGNYIFVHGWIPCNPYSGKIEENWREGDWDSARWYNGMSAWSKGARLPGKTIVCGHFHASWGHSHLHKDRKEYPQKNRKGWEKSFEPFIDDGIIALDACTAYSGFCNCYAIEI